MNENEITIIEASNTVVSIKTNDNLLSLFILSIFCGILIFLAVEIQRKDVSPIFKLLVICSILLVSVLASFTQTDVPSSRA